MHFKILVTVRLCNLVCKTFFFMLFILFFKILRHFNINIWSMIRTFQFLIWKFVDYLEKRSAIGLFGKVQRRNYSLSRLFIGWNCCSPSIIRNFYPLVVVLMRLTGIFWRRKNLYFNILICFWCLKLRVNTNFRCEFHGYFFDIFRWWESFTAKYLGHLILFLFFRYLFKCRRHIRKCFNWAWSIILAVWL